MTQPEQELTFRIRGLDCASCAQTVETGVAQLDGVVECTLTFTTEKMVVVGDGNVTRDQVIERVRMLGYDVDEHSTRSQRVPAQRLSFVRFLWQRRDTRLLIPALLLIIPGVLFHEIFHISHPLFSLTSLVALVIAGYPIALGAVRALLINRTITINMLMTIAAIGAVIIGVYTEAGMVMVLFAIGEALEGFTSSRARDSIRSLMEVVPNDALLLRRSSESSPTATSSCECSGECCSQNSEKRVLVEELQIGDVILVKPGERIPMDGRVVAGASSVNQATITGESSLIEKTEGSEVFASSVNGEGSLEIEVTHLAADTTISRMIAMVEEAQEKRAPVQRFVDQFARYYTPAVVVIALLIAVIPPLAFGQPFWNTANPLDGWLYRALAMLVVACPCALVISTPVSIISAISNAARKGVLIKGGAYLEALSRVKAIAFDKTGTLTAGQPSVVMARSSQCTLTHQAAEFPSLTGEDWCNDCTDMLALASAIEQRSEHPLAHAIVRESMRRGVHHKYPPAQMVQAMTGQGVTGYINGQQITIGSHRYFETTFPHDAVHCTEANEDAARGFTPIMIGRDGTYLGKITLSDTIRESSREALDVLKRSGMSSLIMLTGDNTHTARNVAHQLGMTDVYADLLPHDKVLAVQQMRQQYGPVAMVGDGINDAPALATADVGIAMGVATGGTAQAMETADMSLMQDDLRQLPFVVRLSRAMMQTIRTNVALSLGIKLGFLALVLAGMGTMWMAVIADMGTSLLVTLNGMRLLRYR